MVIFARTAEATMREIQATHPDWTHQECLDEQERLAVAAFERYAAHRPVAARSFEPVK